MRIKNNISSMRAYRNFNANSSALSKDLEKLSSGYKVNRSADDAAGLAISEKMRAQINGIEGATKNARDGISLIQTAEGALTEVHSMLDRMTSLAEQSANGTYDNEVDRAQLQKEVESLKTEVDRIADSSNYNGIKLLDGSLNGGLVSYSGTSFAGRNVSLTQAASVNSGVVYTDLSGIDVSNASIDYLRIDGQTIEIDYANNVEAKKLAGLVAGDYTSAPDEVLESIAAKLEEVINHSAEKQGVNASVKIHVDAVNGKIVFESANKTPASEFSYISNNATTDAAAKKGLMHSLLSGGTDNPHAASINEAKNYYNGRDIDTTDKFHMTINGVSVGVSVPTAILDGDTMTSAATTLESGIHSAVDSYNGARGLTEGQLDEKSGLTGLTKSDFSVKEGENGNFQILYSGHEDVEFSFSDVGERRIAEGLGLTNGSSAKGGVGGLALQIGETSDDYNSLVVSVEDMHTTSLGIKSVDVSTQNGASDAMKAIKNAINKVSDARGGLGALQNRLEHTIGNLGVMRENIQSAESVIRDTDVAEQMMSYTKNNILNQSAQAMLAQANQLPQGVMQLLQG